MVAVTDSQLSGRACGSTNAQGKRMQPLVADESCEENFHEIQLRYKMAAPTVRTLCTISSSPERRQILELACHAAEFRSFPVRAVERAFLREINEHTGIPYLVKQAISQPWHKIFLLVQIDMLRTGWPNKISAAARKDLYQDRGRIYPLLDRVLRCLIDIIGMKKDGRGVTVALDVLRSVSAKVWEGSTAELLQIDGIGAIKMERLAQAGILNIRQLARLEFYHIERLLSRNPPFGQQMVRQLAGFPRLSMSVDIVGTCDQSKLDCEAIGGAAGPIGKLCILRVLLGYENDQFPTWNQQSPWVTLVIECQDGRLLWFWRGSVRCMEHGMELVIGVRAETGESLTATFACEEIVGTLVRQSLKYQL